MEFLEGVVVQSWEGRKSLIVGERRGGGWDSLDSCCYQETL